MDVGDLLMDGLELESVHIQCVRARSADRYCVIFVCVGSFNIVCRVIQCVCGWGTCIHKLIQGVCG